MNDYVFIKTNDLNLKLHFAIAYLQVTIVNDILNNMTLEQYKECVCSADYYALHDIKNNIYFLRNIVN